MAKKFKGEYTLSSSKGFLARGECEQDNIAQVFNILQNTIMQEFQNIEIRQAVTEIEMKISINRLKVIQDGASFYNNETGELICAYRDMVENDQDLNGAAAARKMFMETHPGVILL